jgi:hypothetical protein
MFTNPHTEVMVSLRGAYGLRLDLPCPEWLTPAPKQWPQWSITWQQSSGNAPIQRLDDDVATLHLKPHGYAVLNREAATTAVHLPTAPRPEAFVHPHLSTTAVVTARWADRLTFHAGSFVLNDAVWGVLGDRNAGKSSFLAWQHLAENQPFCDDILVTDGHVAYAGPRCLDLREAAHEHFQIGTALGRIGTRDRWRQSLPPIAAELPLAGFVLLEWGNGPATETVDLADRLRCLASSRGLLAGEEPAAAWMTSLARPIVRFRRPRDWARIDESMTHLNRVLSQ